MNEFQSPESTQSSADPFEQLLRSCKPAGGNQLEQTLYQAGWHAAMAQVEKIAALEANVAANSLLNQQADVAVDCRKATGSWNWFGSGLATGVAVGLLGVWLASSMLDMNHQPMTAGVDSRFEHRSGSDPDEVPHGAVVRQESNQKQTDRNRPASLRREASGLGWSDWFSFASQKNVGLVSDRSELEFAGIDWDALPPSYQKQRKLWQESQRRKVNQEPRSFETLIYGPLTEAKIKELL